MPTPPGGPLAAASSTQDTALRQLTDRRWWLLPLLGWTLLVGLSLLLWQHVWVHALVWVVVLLVLVRYLEMRRQQWLRLQAQAASLEARVAERTKELAGEVTARRHAEEEIRRTHQRFVDLVDSTDGIVWEADARTFVFNFVSRKAETLLGYPVADWLQPGFWVSHLHPEDRTWAPDFCASCTGRLEPHRFEYRFLARDGQVVWLEDIVTVVAEGGELVALRGLMVDITARKRADEEVHRLGQRLSLATRAARLGIWEEQRGSQRVLWDAAMFQIFGLDPKTFGGHYADFMGYVDAEDRPLVQAAVDALVTTGDSLHVIFRIHRPDGETRFIEAHGALQGGGEDGGERLVGVCRDVTERKRNERELERLAITDGLTGCYNRGFLQKALEQEIEQVRRHAAPLSLIMADLDHFKGVNDSFGHAAGDRVLAATAGLVRGVMRRSDLFCRWGGEEFLLLCPHTPPGEAVHLAERVLAALREHRDAEAGVITASLGVASWRPGDDAEALLRRADDLMYRAKADGRNRICSDRLAPVDA